MKPGDEIDSSGYLLNTDGTRQDPPTLATSGTNPTDKSE